MIELHGWLTISETCKDEDLLSQAEIEDINQKVNKIIANCDNDIELQYMNGIAFIRTLLCSNHHTKQVDSVIETYKNISKVATGSYGCIYLRDDEDAVHYNEFQIYLFKKGDCIYKIDKEFSPCIPVIED